jgi:[ribosomal protein S5]-alanine N-acetyltransferase
MLIPRGERRLGRRRRLRWAFGCGKGASVGVLETERLLFRPHEPGDLEPYCAMESDAEYRSPQPVHPREELERSFREAWLPPKSMGLLATVYKPEDRYIGRCGLYPLRDDDGRVTPGEAVLAFYLARQYWGRGLATEAGRAFVRYGFEVLGLWRITAGMNARNQASIRVVEKLGFVRARSGEGGGNQWHEYELHSPHRDGPIGRRT